MRKEASASKLAPEDPRKRSVVIVNKVKCRVWVEPAREASVLLSKHLAHLSLIACHDDGYVFAGIARDLLDNRVEHLLAVHIVI